MTTLTAKTTLSYTHMNKERLLTRFKNYLVENQEIITTGMAMISSAPYYTCSRMLNR